LDNFGHDCCGAAGARDRGEPSPRGVGGALRDFGLLDLAVARPQASMFGQDAYPDRWEKAAALMHSSPSTRTWHTI
jgi:hypothetical protein